MKKYLCAAAAVLLATGAGAGCGGDEAKPLSKADYIKQGDAICEKSGDKIDKAAQKTFADLGQNEMPTEEEITPFVEETFKPEIESQISGLRDLTPPEADADKLNEIYEQVEEALAKVEDDPGTLLEQGADPFEDANKAAQDYGFKVCGEGS